MPSPHQPPGHHALTTYIFVSDALAAMAFYCEHFGAKEGLRLSTPDGTIMHAEMLLGDSRLMLSQEMAQFGTSNAAALGAISQRLLLYVEDVDRTFAQALAAGAKEIEPVTDQFWGDRMGVLFDPFGQQWRLTTHNESISQEEAQKRFAALLAGAAPGK